MCVRAGNRRLRPVVNQSASGEVTTTGHPQTPGTAICGQQLSQRTMEPDERPFQCETCSKRYLRKNNLEDHVLMEHPDTEQVIRNNGMTCQWSHDHYASGGLECK